MADNFEQFLSEVTPIIPVAEDDDEEQFKDYTGYSIDNEDESVLRFKSMVNSPPSLFSLSLLRVCSILNEKSCEPKNAEYVRTFWDERVKSLPEDIQAKIKSQCTFSTLKCLYQDEVWGIEDVSLLIGSIKQEEDMLRYLYWRDPTNPLLRIYEENLIIKPLQDPNLFAKVSEPINATYKYESQYFFEEPLIQAKNKWLQKVQVKGKEVAVELSYNDEQKAIESFNEWSKNYFEGMNWNNVLVVGGSILSSFRYSNTEGVDMRKSFRQNPDIDIYIYGLSTEDAQKKVLEIFNLVQSKTEEALGIWRSNNTITIVSAKYRKAWTDFINIQIILRYVRNFEQANDTNNRSSYTSALEVLLSSDFNSCSVAYNGKEIIAIPRFVVGLMYETNFLDSSIKFGPKLRWERIEKYYKKGFDFSAPLHMRVHGFGPFTTHEEFKRGQALHPNTVQMVELMCLLKPRMLGAAYSTPTSEAGATFGLEREGEFRNWHLTWMKGIWGDRCVRQFPVSGILNDRDNEKQCKSDYFMLKEKLKDIPSWVTQYYKKQQVLLMPHTGIREPPHYLTYIFQQFDVSEGDQHFDPERHKDIEAYVNTHCKFTPYNESAYQCFHLNYLVDKEFNSAANPYVQSNTSLVELVHSTQTELFTWDNFNEYLSGEIKSLEHSFQMHGKNWTLTLQYASPEISFLILKKERDDEKETQDPFYCPKTFVNFTITCCNGEDIVWDWAPRKKYRHSCDYIMDGSQVFTNEEPHNTWMTWITNDYFTPKEGCIKYVTTPQLIYDNETNWMVNMQRIAPNFDAVAM